MILKNKILLFALLLILSSSALAQDRTWQKFSPKTAPWSILAPGPLTPDAEALKPGSSQGNYSYTDFNSFFAVIYKDYGGLNFLPWKKGHLNKQRDLVVKANKGTLLKDEEFTMGKFKGREVQVRMPDNRVIGRESNVKPQYRVQRFRMFFQNNRFYMILAVLPEEQINSKEVTDYLNSFTLR